MSVKTRTEITLYEIDDTEAQGNIAVESHWNRPGIVVLVIAGDRYTVLARDLRTAIENGEKR